MLQRILTTFKDQRYSYAVGFLASTFLFTTLLSVGWHNARRQVTEQRATALGSVAEDPFGVVAQGLLRGVPGGVPGDPPLYFSLVAHAASERQVVKQASLMIRAAAPHEAAEKIGSLVNGAGGYVVSVNRTETKNHVQSAEVVVRVPAKLFDETLSEIRKLATRVENEKIEAEDITSSYSDKASRLNSRRAVERQYLEVLRRASSVKDILEVHQKLGEVREEIETAERQLKLLSHRVAMAGISLTLTSEGRPLALGIQWKPKDNLRLAFNSALQALANYAEAMAGLILLAPVILLWVVTIGFLAGCGWRLFRWFWRFFITRPAAPAGTASEA